MGCTPRLIPLPTCDRLPHPASSEFGYAANKRKKVNKFKSFRTLSSNCFPALRPHFKKHLQIGLPSPKFHFPLSRFLQLQSPLRRPLSLSFPNISVSLSRLRAFSSSLFLSSPEISFPSLVLSLRSLPFVDLSLSWLDIERECRK